MKKIILPLLTALLCVSACQGKESSQMMQTATDTAKRNQSEIWIDVRSQEEFNAGHLQHAYHIPHDEISTKINQLVPDKNTKINLYCRSGRRAEVARKALIDLGYQNVINQGGYQDLIKKGHQ